MWQLRTKIYTEASRHPAEWKWLNTAWYIREVKYYTAINLSQKIFYGMQKKMLMI